MNSKNSLRTIGFLVLAAALIGTITFVPLISAFINGKTPAGADYVTFEGTAGNDYYDSMQYSYFVNQWMDDYSYNPDSVYFNASKSLRVGMTAFGEMADSANTGLAYGINGAEWVNTESWANKIVSQKDLIQGWVLYLNYTRQTKLRCLEAWGIYSDFTTAEGGRAVYTWKGQYTPDDPLANITAGSMSNTGLEILYDSARLGIARTTVTIHDAVYDEDVCQITFTLVFQKDQKYATLFKDYKTLVDPKVLDNINDFALSERYEIDLARGVNKENLAYIHYYHDYGASVYQHPLLGSYDYDVLQAYDPAHQYILFAGFWPNTTEYSVYSPLVPDPVSGDTTVLPYGTAIADTPITAGGEPNTPWVVAQWRYNITTHPNLLRDLAKEGTEREMRFVEIVGMTDYNHDPDYAVDANDTGLIASPIRSAKLAPLQPSNFLDTEVEYILDGKVFNPEDLRSVAGNYIPYTQYSQYFQWIGLGQSAATTDSAGSNLATWIAKDSAYAPFNLFDRNDTMFPWTAPVVTMSGSIPYGLDSFGGNYYETFNNLAKGTGSDPTSYKRTGLIGFAFGIYDNVLDSPPQPIAGGASNWTTEQGEGYDLYYWYPSKSPLTERWQYDLSDLAWTMVGYHGLSYNPNGIMTLGGMKANGLTRYFNDFNLAISREGTSSYALLKGGSVTNSAPTSDPSKNTFDYFPISTWDSADSTFGYKGNYAVISLARDVNGTRGLSIYGWNGRDTFWASAWASQYLGESGREHDWIAPGTVALILNITYDGSLEPTAFTIVKALGTITELGTNDYIEKGYGFDTTSAVWSAYYDYMYYLPEYPTVEGPSVWWFEKLPTTSVATVQYDT